MGHAIAGVEDAGPQRLFGAVVGGRDGAIGEEGEQEAPTPLDRLLQLVAGGMGRDDAEQPIEFGVELVTVGPQGGVGERRPAAADRAGLLQQLAQARGEGDVAGLGGVLGVAQEMSEADLAVGGSGIEAGSGSTFDDQEPQLLTQEIACDTVATIEDALAVIRQGVARA